MVRIFDVIIVGGGPAGIAAARVLSQGAWQVLWIDDGAGHRRKVGEVLSGNARELLEDLALLDIVEGGPHVPCLGRLSSWGSDALETIDERMMPHGPGWHLDRPRFEVDLRRAAMGPQTTFAEARLRDVDKKEGVWRLRLDHNREAWGHFLIDATGWRSALAHALGARRLRDERLVGLCAWYAHPEATDDQDPFTLHEAVEQGWWYTARLPDRSRVAVLHVDPEDAVSIIHSSRGWSRWLSETKHISRKLDGCTMNGPLQCVDASGGRLDTFVGEDWLATGDAALSFDPRHGQGISTALYTGMRAGMAVKHHLRGQTDALPLYDRRLGQLRDSYLSTHRNAYEGEYRWLDRRFWRRRVASAAA